MSVTNILPIVLVIILTVSGGNGMPLLHNHMEESPIIRINPESRLSVADIIRNSGYLPDPINIPNTIMSLFQGVQVAVNNIAQQVPFLRPFSTPDEPRPLANVIILLPVRIANRGTYIIPVFKQDAGVRDIPFDINLTVYNKAKNFG